MQIGDVARQGDVLIEMVASIPKKDLKEKKDKIIALGEATNHAHRIGLKDEAVLLTMNNDMFIKAEGGFGVHHVNLLHPDLLPGGDNDLHNPIQLPAGNFRVIQQQEYTPESWRRVSD